MTEPVRLQLSRKEGFKLQVVSRTTNGRPAINVARPSPWGNPYVIGAPVDKAQVRRWGWRFRNFHIVCEDAAEALRRFNYCVTFDEASHDHIKAKLGGKNLACWCAPGAPCHADILLELANR